MTVQTPVQCLNGSPESPPRCFAVGRIRNSSSNSCSTISSRSIIPASINNISKGESDDIGCDMNIHRSVVAIEVEVVVLNISVGGISSRGGGNNISKSSDNGVKRSHSSSIH